MALVVGAGCTASDDDGAGDGGSSGPGAAGGATATGVTADTVKLGVAGVDPAQLDELGIEADGPPSQALNEAWVAAQNEQGGVAGRRIELVFRPFLPTGDAEAEAACVELTEDQQVFLVTGIFTNDTPLCFTEAHDTPYLGQFGHSAERDRRSTAPFVALEMSDERQRLAGLQVFLDEDALDGRVALHWDAPDAAVVDEFVKPALDEAGVEVVVETTLDDSGGDQAAQDQALDTIVERIRAADPDVVLNVSGFLPPLEADTLAHVTVAAPYAPTKGRAGRRPRGPAVRRRVQRQRETEAFGPPARPAAPGPGRRVDRDRARHAVHPLDLRPLVLPRSRPGHRRGRSRRRLRRPPCRRQLPRH
jgi:hypothetical protein